MKYVTQHTDADEQVLIICARKQHQFIDAITPYFTAKKTHVTSDTQLPARIEQFHIVLILHDHERILDELQNKSHNRAAAVVVRDIKKAQKLAQDIKGQSAQRTKIIHLPSFSPDEDVLDRMLWFIFSHSEESLLTITLDRASSSATQTKQKKQRGPYRVRKRMIGLGMFVGIAMYAIITFALFITSNYYFIRSLGARGTQQLQRARSIHAVANTLYTPVRPIFFLFSAGLFTDEIKTTNEHIVNLSTQYEATNRTTSLLLRNMIEPPNPNGAGGSFQDMLTNVEQGLIHMIETINVLQTQRFLWTPFIDNPSDVLTAQKKSFQTLLPIVRTIAPTLQSSTYLLVVTDNTRLRPGGGEVRYVGTLGFENGRVSGLQLESAAALDAQLATSIEAPESIRQFMGQSFLTITSAFVDAESTTNLATIREFLLKERGVSAVDGMVLLSYDGLASLIGAYDSLYLPEFNESISQESFFIKDELHKNDVTYMSAIFHALGAAVSSTEAAITTTAFIDILNAKQALILPQDNEQLHKVISDSYWAGHTIPVRCALESNNCAVDFIYPLETNLTPNYSNRYVQRDLDHTTVVAEDGSVGGRSTFTIYNDPSSIAPTPTDYRTFIQFLLPGKTTVNSVRIDGQSPKDTLSLNAGYTILGLALEVPASSSSVIEISYTLDDTIKLEDGVVETILQKQTGAPNYQFDYTLQLPQTLKVDEQNFQSVVNKQNITYNSVLNSDRIFIVTFKKR